MTSWQRQAFANLAIIVATAGTAAAEHLVTVRTYQNAGLSVEDLADAEKTVSAIFAKADIALQWRICPRTDGAPGDACSDPLEPRDIVLRLVMAPPGRRDGGRNVLGSALHADARSGTMVTVFVDRVDAAARRMPNGRNVLLGRVIAHEIGHLLLRTGHGAAGLMRGRWTLDSIRRDEPGEWLFSQVEGFEMRKVVVAGLAAHPQRR